MTPQHSFLHYRIHICVTLMHTKNGLADKFLEDVKANVDELMKNPTKPVEGKVSCCCCLADWFLCHYEIKKKKICYFRWPFTVLHRHYLIDRLSVNLRDGIWIPLTTLHCRQSKRTDSFWIGSEFYFFPSPLLITVPVKLKFSFYLVWLM